jgi:hypothetical protein
MAAPGGERAGQGKCRAPMPFPSRGGIAYVFCFFFSAAGNSTLLRMRR